MDINFDWEKVEQAVVLEKTRYAFDTHGHLFRKIAFDRFKPIHGLKSQLWELRKGEDGKDYLFALYNEGEDLVSQSNKDQPWEAVSDSTGQNITLAYKKVPVYCFASAQYGFEAADAQDFANFIEEKAQDKEWVNELLSKAMTDERAAAVSKLIGD
jgi:hypothetical protein